ncbi:glutathione S-transferase [Pseudoroseicyclus aestuarii]|uniref:Glutathione S-transferase n=2 Tax=Pseudoroseicyclus aestuarii TaxID=1795041 RepID=A0A318SVY7_9RHOB|nr:glutathione S-transferase family protein [Pseudoroseicyclus aestuarii]PYE84007.1 glutathione S-transferase [Pseudoroseicyclus aestuarii]
MPILYHSPNSRSSAVVTLLDELGAADVEIREVTIPRQDGSGSPDAANPHPEKKVPYLIDDDETVRERGAIMLYLTDMYPQAGLGPLPGQPGRGAYLSWLSWYQGVMEPVMVMQFAGLSHPALGATFRDPATMIARLSEALARGPWLLGEAYSAADLLCSSPFLWFPESAPDDPAIRDWIERCAARPAVKRTAERDAKVAA